MKLFKIVLFIVTITCFCDILSAQTGSIDSLKSALKTAENDTSKVNLLNSLSKEFINASDFEKALEQAKEAQVLSEKIEFKKGLAHSLNNIGIIHYYLGDFSKSLEYYLKALEQRKLIGDKKSVGASLNNIGGVYREQGNYPKALEYFFASLKIREETSDNKGMASCLGNIGSIYFYQENYIKALEYFLKSLKIREKIGDKFDIASSYNSIASVYPRLKNDTKALEYYLKSLNLRLEVGDKLGAAGSLNNIGVLYRDQRNYEKGLEYFLQSEKINEEIGNKQGIANNLNNIAKTYLGQKLFNDALKYFTKAKEVAAEIGALSLLKSNHEGLSETYAQLNQPWKALEHYKTFVAVRDSIFNEENTKKLVRSEMNFEFEKKEHAARLEQEKKEVLHKAQLKQQTMQRNAFIAGFTLVILLAGVSFKGYKQKQKANKLLSHQKDVIEEKNKDIMDSIHYANRIQTALLNEEDRITEYLSEHFTLFKPKDILSGDFYWSLKKQDHLYMAAADCTGHGVPGAMMSMLGIAFLNEITSSDNLIKPGEILDELRNKIIKELKSKDGVTKDGMDISLMRLNLQTLELEWSGANNPLWILNNNEVKSTLREIKGNKQPIGFSENSILYTNNTIQLYKNDIIYLITDGYADQFGGEKGKKFKYAKLKDLLLSIADKPMNEQKEILNATFEAWKGSLEQVDDVCIIGVKI